MAQEVLSVLSLAGVVSLSLSWITAKRCFLSQSLRPWNNFTNCGKFGSSAPIQTMLANVLIYFLLSRESPQWTLVGVTRSLLGIPWDSVRSSAFDQNQAHDTDGEKQHKCLCQTGKALPGNPSIIYFMISALWHIFRSKRDFYCWLYHSKKQ